MIKYKVYEVARDLGATSKEIIGVLKEYLNEEKKHMTALVNKELDIILEYYTQNNQVDSFDEYFSLQSQEDETLVQKNTVPSVPSPQENLKKAPETSEKPNNNSNVVKKSSSNVNSLKSNHRPERKKTPEKIIKIHSNEIKKGDIVVSEENTDQNRIINTRTVSMNIEKYNEKYDKMAAEKVQTDNIIRKQKINQRSQRRGKLKNLKRETEAERLSRIAQERKARSITITVPDEITVADLAMKLKATAAEVIKKLMMMGMMVTINDVIDFDTASLVAM